MDRPLKICVVDSYERIGGASIAAWRLVDALEAETKCEVSKLYRFSRKEGVMIDHCRAENEGSDVRFELNEAKLELIERFRSDWTNTYFSADSPAWDISGREEVQQADIIHLHWVSNFLSVESLRRLGELGKPIVWTLHDERTFSGGCHYTTGCDGYKESCAACPQLDDSLHWLPRAEMEAAVEVFSSVPVYFACPSKWMGHQLEQSAIFRSGIHQWENIPYSLDLEIFRPVKDENEKQQLRAKLGLPAQAICIVAGSVSWEDERKGGRFLKRSLELLAEKIPGSDHDLPEVCVVTYGEGGLDLDGIAVHNVGVINGEVGMSELLRCCDLYVIMTREDNLPNTVLESFACGLPVLGTSVGGVPDMVENGVNGCLVAKDDSQAMANRLEECLSDNETCRTWGRNARTKAEGEYSPAVQAGRYSDVYQKLSANFKPAETKSSGSAFDNPVRVPPRQIPGEFVSVLASEFAQASRQAKASAVETECLQGELALAELKRKDAEGKVKTAEELRKYAEQAKQHHQVEAEGQKKLMQTQKDRAERAEARAASAEEMSQEFFAKAARIEEEAEQALQQLKTSASYRLGNSILHPRGLLRSFRQRIIRRFRTQ